MTWLDRYTGRGQYSRGWAWEVHALCWHADVWSVATEGRGILAVRSESLYTTATTLSDHDARMASQSLLRFLDQRPPTLLRTDLASLWAWCGGVQLGRCEVHQEYVDAGIPCEECDGSGWFRPDGEHPDPGELAGGVIVDRSRLCWWLAPELTDHGETCGVAADPALPAVFIDGRDWRLILKGMDQSQRPRTLSGPPPVVHWPRFHPDPDYLALWLEARADPDIRGVLGDWLEEHHPDDPYADVLRGVVVAQGG